MNLKALRERKDRKKGEPSQVVKNVLLLLLQKKRTTTNKVWPSDKGEREGWGFIEGVERPEGDGLRLRFSGSDLGCQKNCSPPLV